MSIRINKMKPAELYANLTIEHYSHHDSNPIK